MHNGLNDIESMDLNLLRVLDVLLDEGSVTAAARRLHRTPSAVSHALGRLRDALDDPLLVRSGNRLVPSPRADALREPLSRVLADLGRVLAVGAAFDPAASTRRFALAAPDALGLLLPELLAAVQREAPGVSIELVAPASDNASDSLGPGAADLLVAGGAQAGEGLMMAMLGRLQHGVVLRADHPAIQDDSLSAADYGRLGHVFVRTGIPGPSLVSRALDAASLARRVAVVVPSFVLAPIVVADTDHVFTAPEPVIRALVARLGLVVLPAPVAIPDVPVGMVWHRRDQEDPGHRWLRGVVGEVVRGALGAG